MDVSPPSKKTPAWLLQIVVIDSRALDFDAAMSTLIFSWPQHGDDLPLACIIVFSPILVLNSDHSENSAQTTSYIEDSDGLPHESIFVVCTKLPTG
jgi:hypothetical protein